MKDKEKKLYLISLAIIVSIAVGMFFMFKNTELQKRIDISKSILEDIVNNKKAINLMSDYITSSKRRIEGGKNRNINTEIEKIADAVSSKKNIKKIIFLTKKKEGQYNREDYEIRIEGIDINTFVNFLYRLKTAELFIKISGFNLSLSFENPSLLNATLVISYIS